MPETPVPKPLLILASNSPRRRELLTEAGYRFEVVPPTEDVECGVCSQNGPAGLVTDLAYRKAAAVRELLRSPSGDRDKGRSRQGAGESVILAADTVAECDGMVLGKPRDEEDARAMLRQLSGRRHRVLTGVCVWPLGLAEPEIEVAVTELRMDLLSDVAINEYLATGGWEGKAGAFGYQDRLGWVHVDSGSESNVVGLPMELVGELLAAVEVLPDGRAADRVE
jgi:septum formation protein